MQNEDPGKISYSEIGGLNDQIRILRETVELPITNPELFKRVGIKPPKVNYQNFREYYSMVHQVPEKL
jgi:26S proteasome regulatory subunit T4